MTVSEIHVDDPGRILAIRSWPENHSPASLTRRKLSARDTRIQRWTSPKLVRDWKFTGIGIIVRATIRANHVASHGPFRDRRSWMPMGVFVYTSERENRSEKIERTVRTEASVAAFSYWLTERYAFAPTFRTSITFESGDDRATSHRDRVDGRILSRNWELWWDRYVLGRCMWNRFST